MPVKLNSAGGGSVTMEVGSTASNFTQTLPSATTTLVGTDTTQTLTNKTIQGGTITRGTAQASTSGTSIDFTSIPSWVKRITVMFSAVSLSGTDNFLIQLGDSGGIETTGYVAQSATGSTVNNSTAGFISRGNDAANSCSGLITICNISGNTWVEYGGFNRTTATEVTVCAGTKTLSDTLTQLRITTTGTNTFDAGSINILYE